ncbi:hypothetical protein [Burkholderia alba]|uniref:hypothetical protein n=1 Tax=Burkholderia alba TaxID=2683677 RepID=UPI002B059B20|nr:hypothetical protein [Burkholderia alba]
MLDIATSDTLRYDFGGRAYTIQIYRDNQDNKKYYIVPQPQFAVAANGLPEFSLRQFKNSNSVSGQCNFQTVLQTPPGSIEAVRNKFGQDIRIGGWDWTSGMTWFNYQYPDEKGQLSSHSALAWPSLAPTTSDIGQASALASFSISLPDQGAVSAFITAFGPSGSGGGTYELQYQMHVPGTLPGVSVTVGFNSTTAFDYEQKVHIDRNVWGSETGRTVQVQQYLSQSQAGSIDYVWGKIDPLSPQGQVVTNWANQTLQNAVTNAVNSAIAMMQSNHPSGDDYTFSMSQVSSFSYTYSQNQVVDWIATSSVLLQPFSKELWAQLYQTVDYTPLTVTFYLKDIEQTAAHISSVQITVQSPSGNDTKTLNKDVTSWPFSRPAVTNPDGTPNLNYSYQYLVSYTNGTSYQSGVILGNAGNEGGATVTLTAGSLAALAVTFQTSGVDYGTKPQSVRQVEVDFVFVNTNAPPGLPAENKTLSYVFYSNDEKWNVAFLTALPYTTFYQYSVRYVMGDNSQVVTAPELSNDGTVWIYPSLVEQEVRLNPRWIAEMENVVVSAYYVDPNNRVSVPGKSWQIEKKGDKISPWTFLAPDNPNAYCNVTLAEFDYKGRIVTYPTPWYVPQRQPLNLSAIQTPVMVTIDPSLIQWNLYSTVTLDIYLLDQAGNQKSLHSFQFTKGMGKQFYSFMLDGQDPTLTWYYTGAYFPLESQQVNIPQTKMTSHLLVLPRTWSSKQLLANELPYVDAEKHAHALEVAHQRLFAGVNLADETANAK